VKLPDLNHGVETLLDFYGVYHLARIEANPMLGDLAPSFADAQARFRERLEQYKAAEIAAVTAMAVARLRDAGLSEAIAATVLAVLSRTGNDRRSPRFRQYFPRGLLRSCTPRPPRGWPQRRSFGQARARRGPGHPDPGGAAV